MRASVEDASKHEVTRAVLDEPHRIGWNGEAKAVWAQRRLQLWREMEGTLGKTKVRAIGSKGRARAVGT